MKKIFPYLFCTALISSAFSQADNHYPFNKNFNTYNANSNSRTRYERDREIRKVNFFNNIKVQQLVKDGTLDIWQKHDALNALESQRIQKINSIYEQYSNAIAISTKQQRGNFDEKEY